MPPMVRPRGEGRRWRRILVRFMTATLPPLPLAALGGLSIWLPRPPWEMSTVTERTPLLILALVVALNGIHNARELDPVREQLSRALLRAPGWIARWQLIDLAWPASRDAEAFLDDACRRGVVEEAPTVAAARPASPSEEDRAYVYRTTGAGEEELKRAVEESELNRTRPFVDLVGVVAFAVLAWLVADVSESGLIAPAVLSLTVMGYLHAHRRDNAAYGCALAAAVAAAFGLRRAARSRLRLRAAVPRAVRPASWLSASRRPGRGM